MEIRFDHKRISALREQHGLTIYETARKLGTTQQNVSNWEVGIGPNISSLEKICALFGVTPNYFFEIK